MAKTQGITIVRDSRGRKRQMIIDLSKVSREIQDLIDGIVSDLRRNEPAKKAENVFNRLDKKFNLKTASSK